jgi:RND family efflux transporter MFP subunit
MTAPSASTKPEWAQSKREKQAAERAASGQPPRRRRWPWILLALVVLGGIAVALFLANQPAPPPDATAESETEAAEPRMQLTEGELTTLEPQRLTRTVKVTGSLVPQARTQVSSQVNARVVAVMARPGDAVEAGHVLVALDADSLQNQLDQAVATAEATRAQLQLAESQLTRTQDLIERGLTASSGLEQALSSAEAQRANLAALESQVETARRAVDSATIESPIDGIVSERQVEPGQMAQPGATLMTIVDLDTLDLDAATPIGESARVQRGQAVAISVEGFPGRTFEGTVTRINPVAAEGTRTISTYVSLENTDGVLRGGMFATGQIVVDEVADAIAVPAVAIREDAEGFFVLKLEDDAIVRQAIEEGGSWNSGRMIEVTSGLAAGDRIVTAPLTQLEPGDLIEMVEG